MEVFSILVSNLIYTPLMINIDIISHIFNSDQSYFIFSDHKMKVYEYTYPFYIKKTPPPNPISKDDFVTNELRIAYATARTLCSYHLDDKELYFDIVASLLSHFNFITKNNDNYLQLIDSRLNRLRDFSKTARIGELAQGINYLFVQEVLLFPYIVDFHLFYKNVYEKVHSGSKTPDFIILKYDFNESGLFESKGEAQKSFKITGKRGKLNEALKQLRIIQPCVNKLIPCCTRFETNRNDRDSSIHYSIIQKRCSLDDDLISRIFKQHYASWFYLVGDFERANILLLNEVIGTLENDEKYELGDDDDNNKIYWLKQPLRFEIASGEQKKYLRIYTHFFSNKDFNIGIYKVVVDNLILERLEREELERTPFDPRSNGNYHRFSDGTVIRLRTDSNN
jgi:hypothetical protein